MLRPHFCVYLKSLREYLTLKKKVVTQSEGITFLSP